jgi:hypothetical protein
VRAFFVALLWTECGGLYDPLTAHNRSIEQACEDTSAHRHISLRNPWAFAHQGIGHIEEGIGPPLKTSGKVLTDVSQHVTVHARKSPLVFDFSRKNVTLSGNLLHERIV